jgi:hypothetical protein
MKRSQYRAIVVAQKKQQNPPKKLIHLLINFRTQNWTRYPQGFTDMMRDIKRGSKAWDYDARYYFIYSEGTQYNQPIFNPDPHLRLPKEINECRDFESDLPF